VQIKQTTRRLGIIQKCARKAKFHIHVSRSVLQRRLMYGGYALPLNSRCAGPWAFFVAEIRSTNDLETVVQ
jgi:hypothetical protein